MTHSGPTPPNGHRDQPPAELPERLPCGTALDDLTEQIADGHASQLTEHQGSCTHCQAALLEIERLWAPVAELAGVRLLPPPHLMNKIMSLVRELALEVWHVVLPGDRGHTRIAARVLAAIARRAAARARGVRVVLGRSSQARVAVAADEATRAHRQPGSAVGIAGQQVVVDLAVVTTYDLPIPRVADDVRNRVLADLQRLAGLRDVAVNITVDDVSVPPES